MLIKKIGEKVQKIYDECQRRKNQKKSVIWLVGYVNVYEWWIASDALIDVNVRK